MADPHKLSRNVPPFTAEPSAIEALERLRDSYKGMTEQESSTETIRLS
jgi:hypothetical protein